MKFMLMIMGTADAPRLSDADMSRIFAQLNQIRSDMVAQKKFVGSNRLRPIAEAASVRMRGEERIVTDGPFSEAKEVLGGYFMVECDSKQEAIEWAKRFPFEMEVRQVWEM